MYQNTIRYFPSGSFTGLVWSSSIQFLDGFPTPVNNVSRQRDWFIEFNTSDLSSVMDISESDYDSDIYFHTSIGFEIVNTYNTQNAPSLDIISIEFGNYYTKNQFVCVPSNTTIYNFFNGSYFNYISYLDTNGYRYNMLFPVQYHAFKSYTYNPYYYYFH